MLAKSDTVVVGFCGHPRLLQIVTKSERQKISVETRDFNGRDYSPAGPMLNTFVGELYLHALHSSNSPKSLKSHRDFNGAIFI